MPPVRRKLPADGRLSWVSVARKTPKSTDHGEVHRDPGGRDVDVVG